MPIRTETTAAPAGAAPILAGLALLQFLLLWSPGVWLGNSGYFIDEGYYIACAKHLDWGYVDHPPFCVFVLRALIALLGESLAVVRLLPALAGSLCTLLTARLARRFGADGFGQILAAIPVVIGVTYQVIFGFYSMNAFELLLWVGLANLIVEIELREEPRLWLVVGLLLGIGVENKHTIVLYVATLGAGMLLGPMRRHLASKWLWLGLLLATLLAIPNLAWQATHGWASLEFYRNQDLQKNVPTPILQGVTTQVLAMNPTTLPIWLAGLALLLGSPRLSRHRAFGWAFLLMFGMLVAGGKSRPDRIVASYFPLFAAGGVALGEIARARRWLRAALSTAMGLGAAVLTPVAVPILPPEITSVLVQRLGVVPQIEKGPGKRAPLPQWQADKYDWPEFVDDVERVVLTLPPEERANAILFANSYGDAGALDLQRAARKLPPVYATHNSYFFWGPPKESPTTVIAVAIPESDADPSQPPRRLRELFEEVELGTQHDCEWCMAWRDRLAIWVARRPKVDLARLWPELARFN